MKIRVRYFALFKEITRCEEEMFDLDQDRSVSELIKRMTTRHPELNREKIMIAVNEAFADPTMELDQDDVVAVFPIVSGG